MLLIVLFCGCQPPSSLSEGRAKEVAKREALAKGWKRVEVSKVRFQEGVWLITVWRLPKTPGGFALVEVSEDGQLLSFKHGH